MVYRTYFAAVFGELERAFNAGDTPGAARCFAFPTLIRSRNSIEVFDTEAALQRHFEQQIANDRHQGIVTYAFDLGDVFASGPVGLAEVVWRQMGSQNATHSKARIWYHMVDTARGWRIESVRNQD